MWGSALLPSFVWQLLCNAQAVIAMPFVSLNSSACVWFWFDKIHVLCKTFSNRRVLILESYVWSTLQIPEDLLPFGLGLEFTLAFTQEKREGLVYQSRNLGACLAVIPMGVDVPRYLEGSRASKGRNMRAEWEWGNGHFRCPGSRVQQWLWSSVNEVWPDHRPHNHGETAY